MTTAQRHNYEYAVDPAADTAPARVVRMVGHGKRVLELGAGPGSIARILFGVNGCRVTALEIDATALDKLAPYCERVCQADLNRPDWADCLGGAADFEVVVLADVLEHVRDPAAVLAKAASLLAGSGHMVISLPHAGHVAIHACLFEEDFEYRDWGLLDRTHIRFFGLRNMQQLFEQCGLKIIAAEFVVREPEQTEFAARWPRMPEALKQALALNPFGRVYQVVVSAVPLAAPGKALSLLDMPVQGVQGAPAAALAAAPLPSPPAAGAESRLRLLARHHLSPQTRARLRRLLGACGLRV